MLTNLKEFVMILVRFFAEATRLTWAAIGVGLLVALIYFGIFFGGMWGFREDADKAGKIPIVHPDYDYVESRWSHLKILIWVSLSVGSGILAYHQLPGMFPGLFKK